MNVWLPYIRGGSGTDVFTHALREGLTALGANAVVQGFPHALQYAPWALMRAQAPRDTNIILANSWNAFAFRRIGLPLVVVVHHCIFDPSYLPYRTRMQAVFHEGLIRRFERWSFTAADQVVAVSGYTSSAVAERFPGVIPAVILNGIDTDFFSPDDTITSRFQRPPFRLLFVGNLTNRKGADLLPRIMAHLGNDYQLQYTRGLRTSDPFPKRPNMHPLGRLTQKQLRDAYRSADLLLFPTRLEGFGYAAAEALACGTPVVSSQRTAVAEVVIDGVTGKLCPPNDALAFAEAITDLCGDVGTLSRMRRTAREQAVSRFTQRRMDTEYLQLLESTCPNVQHASTR